MYYIYFDQNMQNHQNSRCEQGQVDGRWTHEEHQKFLKSIMMYGKNWKMIQQAVITRTTTQVRSHAQKFFLKLAKCEKDRKKNKKKEIYVPSRAEQQLLLSLSEETITENTPFQILVFLRKETYDSPKKKQIQKAQICLDFKQQQFKSNHHMLDEMLENANQDESFLVSLIKHNIGIFRNGQLFKDLIDLPNFPRDEKQEQETTNKRKKSFCLFEEQDENRYQQMKKTMGTD